MRPPNIVTVYDIGEREGGRFIVMELVAGRTFGTLIGDDLPLEPMLSIGHQMAKATRGSLTSSVRDDDVHVTARAGSAWRLSRC